jgi:hypothetical protein
MRRWGWLAVFLLVGAPAWATQINVDTQTHEYVCSLFVSDGAIFNAASNGEGISCNHALTALNIQGGTIRNWHVPATQRLVLVDWGVTIIGAVGGATEDCNIVLVTDQTPTGVGSTLSTLTTSAAVAEAECSTGSQTVDAAGDTCTIPLSANVAGGGYWRLEWLDRDGGGANTCASWQEGTVWVRGRLQPQ